MTSNLFFNSYGAVKTTEDFTSVFGGRHLGSIENARRHLYFSPSQYSSVSTEFRSMKNPGNFSADYSMNHNVGSSINNQLDLMFTDHERPRLLLPEPARLNDSIQSQSFSGASLAEVRAALQVNSNILSDKTLLRDLISSIDNKLNRQDNTVFTRSRRSSTQDVDEQYFRVQRSTFPNSDLPSSVGEWNFKPDYIQETLETGLISNAVREEEFHTPTKVLGGLREDLPSHIQKRLSSTPMSKKEPKGSQAHVSCAVITNLDDSLSISEISAAPSTVTTPLKRGQLMVAESGGTASVQNKGKDSSDLLGLTPSVVHCQVANKHSNVFDGNPAEAGTLRRDEDAPESSTSKHVTFRSPPDILSSLADVSDASEYVEDSNATLMGTSLESEVVGQENDCFYTQVNVALPLSTEDIFEVPVQKGSQTLVVDQQYLKPVIDSARNLQQKFGNFAGKLQNSVLPSTFQCSTALAGQVEQPLDWREDAPAVISQNNKDEISLGNDGSASKVMISNPQLQFDVNLSDSEDAVPSVLSGIAPADMASLCAALTKALQEERGKRKRLECGRVSNPGNEVTALLRDLASQREQVVRRTAQVETLWRALQQKTLLERKAWNAEVETRSVEDEKTELRDYNKLFDNGEGTLRRGEESAEVEDVELVKERLLAERLTLETNEMELEQKRAWVKEAEELLREEKKKLEMKVIEMQQERINLMRVEEERQSGAEGALVQVEILQREKVDLLRELEERAAVSAELQRRLAEVPRVEQLEACLMVTRQECSDLREELRVVLQENTLLLRRRDGASTPDAAASGDAAAAVVGNAAAGVPSSSVGDVEARLTAALQLERDRGAVLLEHLVLQEEQCWEAVKQRDAALSVVAALQRQLALLQQRCSPALLQQAKSQLECVPASSLAAHSSISCDYDLESPGSCDVTRDLGCVTSRRPPQREVEPRCLDLESCGIEEDELVLVLEPEHCCEVMQPVKPSRDQEVVRIETDHLIALSNSDGELLAATSPSSPSSNAADDFSNNDGNQTVRGKFEGSLLLAGTQDREVLGYEEETRFRDCTQREDVETRDGGTVPDWNNRDKSQNTEGPQSLPTFQSTYSTSAENAYSDFEKLLDTIQPFSSLECYKTNTKFGRTGALRQCRSHTNKESRNWLRITSNPGTASNVDRRNAVISCDVPSTDLQIEDCGVRSMSERAQCIGGVASASPKSLLEEDAVSSQVADVTSSPSPRLTSSPLCVTSHLHFTSHSLHSVSPPYNTSSLPYNTSSPPYNISSPLHITSAPPLLALQSQPPYLSSFTAVAAVRPSPPPGGDGNGRTAGEELSCTLFRELDQEREDLLKELNELMLTERSTSNKKKRSRKNKKDRVNVNCQPNEQQLQEQLNRHGLDLTAADPNINVQDEGAVGELAYSFYADPPTHDASLEEGLLEDEEEDHRSIRAPTAPSLAVVAGNADGGVAVGCIGRSGSVCCDTRHHDVAYVDVERIAGDTDNDGENSACSSCAGQHDGACRALRKLRAMSVMLNGAVRSSCNIESEVGGRTQDLYR